MQIVKSIRALPGVFWILNLIQMAERMAFWIALLQLPVYIAQKDNPGGLQWEQTTKGIIFFWWAIMQNITPVFTGAFADRYGHKKVMAISFLIIISGYILLGTQTQFWPFLAGALVLGFGNGIFKPAIQGSIANSLNDANASIGWSIHAMLINCAVFLAPPITIFLKGFHWKFVFFGSAAIFILNYIFLFCYKDFPVLHGKLSGNFQMLKATTRNFFKPRLFIFIIIMSGFTLTYMQFYETLPNFIIDWTDSANMAVALGLPDFMLMETNRGLMLAYEWYYNLSTGFIILAVVLVSRLFSKIPNTIALFLGISISSAGLMLCGLGMSGFLAAGGVLIYTLGEMITNPKFNEYIGSFAPAGQKAQYMSFLNFSWALGLGGGALLGGWLYKNWAEKSYLALRYLKENFSLNNIEPENSFSILLQKTGLSASDATVLLWDQYSPWIVWGPFFIIGSISALSMIFYHKKMK